MLTLQAGTDTLASNVPKLVVIAERLSPELFGTARVSALGIVAEVLDIAPAIAVLVTGVTGVYPTSAEISQVPGVKVSGDAVTFATVAVAIEGAAERRRDCVFSSPT